MELLCNDTMLDPNMDLRYGDTIKSALYPYSMMIKYYFTFQDGETFHLEVWLRLGPPLQAAAIVRIDMTIVPGIKTSDN